MLCGFSSLWWPFGWNWSYLGFLGIIWRTCGSKCGGEGGGIFPTLCVECCLVLHFICFHVLHNVQRKISAISWCWKHYLELTYFQDHCVYIVTVTGICVDSQGKVREFFFCQPRGNPLLISLGRMVFIMKQGPGFGCGALITLLFKKSHNISSFCHLHSLCKLCLFYTLWKTCS